MKTTQRVSTFMTVSQVFAVSLALASLPSRSFAQLTCESLIPRSVLSLPRQSPKKDRTSSDNKAELAAKNALAVIEGTSDWRDAIDPLLESTDMKLRQQFEVRGQTKKGTASEKLPSLPSDYENASFVESKRFKGPLPEGATLIERAEFGYDLSGGFRSLAKLNYIVVGKDGKVIEVGGGSRVLLRELRWHIFGRTLNKVELRKISEINRKIIDVLRADPRAKAKVKEFAAKRKWPKGLEDKAQLAYFSESILPLKEWALKNGYTMAEIRDAGWFLLTFDDQGRPLYKTNGEDSIKIPYFSNANEREIPVWRTRALKDRNDGKKYLGWQLDRSIRRDFTIAETLYNGWKLGSARGKTVVITEGEFKCLVAEEATGHVTVGIPGITQFDGTTAKRLVDSGAKEFVVILDRDPVGKGLARLDEVTDSQRAAYMIARELQAAGATNVRIGRLPDAFDGAKLGIDDLILAKGPEPYLETIAKAVTPEQYAKDQPLDLTLQDLLMRRQRLRKTLENYTRSAESGGPQVSEQEVQRARDAFNQVENAYKQYLATTYHAKSIGQPSYRHRYLPVADKRVQTPALRLSNGKPLERDAATDEVIVLNPVTPSGIGALDIQRSNDVAADSAFTPNTDREKQLLLIAGKLAHDYPLEEYHFEFGVKVGTKTSIPIVIIKKANNKVVAMAEVNDDFTRLLQLLRPN